MEHRIKYGTHSNSAHFMIENMIECLIFVIFYKIKLSQNFPL